MTERHILWYFADPMCSWCWGFAPVIETIADTYKNRLRLALMMGGLRPGTTTPLTPASREEILHHWRDVHRLSGQPFQFESALPEGFVYDTEPACRAVVTMSRMQPAGAFLYLKAIQAAFYAAGRDVTQPDVLAELARSLGVDDSAFRERFASDAMRQATLAQFAQTGEIGVRGFPTVILQHESQFELLTSGYRSFDALQPKIDQWLAAEPNA